MPATGVHERGINVLSARKILAQEGNALVIISRAMKMPFCIIALICRRLEAS